MARQNDKEKELAERARRGDRKAFSEIVRMNMNSIVALTYKMTSDRQTAADLAQETFVAAWKGIGQFRAEASLSSWLYRIATNKTLNFLAREKQIQRLTGGLEALDSTASDKSSPSEELERREMKELMLLFMGTLPPQQRIAFELRFYKQLSFAEISEATSSALGTVKTNYREAVKKLRQYAIEQGWR